MEKIYKLSSRALALVVVCLLSLTASAQETTIKTVADKGTSGKFFAKLCPKTDVAITIPRNVNNVPDLSVVSAYSVTSDGNDAYFHLLGVQKGRFVVKAGECAIIKTSESMELVLEPASGRSSVMWNDLICPAADTSLEDFKTTYDVDDDQYIYMLTNLERNGGFGFTHFGGTTLKAGNFYIISSREPSASGRLNMVWDDADGIAELETTGIQAVEKTAQDDAVYNLQGVKVAAPTAKGIYIRNGKKFLVK